MVVTGEGFIDVELGGCFVFFLVFVTLLNVLYNGFKPFSLLVESQFEIPLSWLDYGCLVESQFL